MKLLDREARIKAYSEWLRNGGDQVDFVFTGGFDKLLHYYEFQNNDVRIKISNHFGALKPHADIELRFIKKWGVPTQKYDFHSSHKNTDIEFLKQKANHYYRRYKFNEIVNGEYRV